MKYTKKDDQMDSISWEEYITSGYSREPAVGSGGFVGAGVAVPEAA